MKKIIPLLLAVVAFAACEKDPDMGELENKYVVYTNYDKKADFSAYGTYYLPDSILVIGDKKDGEYWSDGNAQTILNAFAQNMEKRGYQPTTRETAQLGLQVSYVRSTYFLTDFGQPEWWWGYPGYWDTPYWGNWGAGWYYPYSVTYSYTTGSYLAELVNLSAPQGQNAKLPVMWTCYLSGLLSNSTQTNVNLAVEGVNQAFTQSAYLTNKK